MAPKTVLHSVEWGTSVGECHLAPKTVLHSVEWGTSVGECVFEISLTCGHNGSVVSATWPLRSTQWSGGQVWVSVFLKFHSLVAALH